MTSLPAPLLRLWLDAAECVQPAVEATTFAQAIRRTVPLSGDSKSAGGHTAKVRFSSGLTPRAEVEVDWPWLQTLSHSEQVEILASLQALIIQWSTGLSNSAFEDLCRRIGCDSWWYSKLVRDRWSRIWYSCDPSPISERFEDRPRCPLCERLVVTGERYPDKHEACMGYAQRVLVPAILQARRQS